MTAGRTAWTGRPTDHAVMVTEHGHSHGSEEHIAWALHGHSHEKMDHHHSVAVLPEHLFDVMVLEVDVLWHAPDTGYQPPPVYRQLRLPRA